MNTELDELIQGDDEHEPGWLCVCGHWQEDNFHCRCCGNEPPWGCNCSVCDDKYYEDDHEEFYFPGPWDD